MVEILKAEAAGISFSVLIGALLAASYCRLLWHQTQRMVNKTNLWVSCIGGFLTRATLIVGVLYWLYAAGGSLWLSSGLISFVSLRWLFTRAVARRIGMPAHYFQGPTS